MLHQLRTSPSHDAGLVSLEREAGKAAEGGEEAPRVASDPENSPAVLTPVRTSQQLTVHLPCQNSPKMSRCLGTGRHHQLLLLQPAARLPTLLRKQPPRKTGFGNSH